VHTLVDTYLKISVAMLALPITVATMIAGPYTHRPEKWPNWLC
jgi:hypothetical protein